MIYAKTRIRKIPKSCKDCALAQADFGENKRCVITGYDCPWEKSSNGNWKYGKPIWCPLVEVQNNG